MAKEPPKKRKPRRGDPAAEVAIVGELHEETVADVLKDLLDIEPGSAVSLYFDSSGGSVYSALAVATLMRHRRLKATGIVLSECSSAALIVFAACQKRFVTPRSVFLFHRIKWRGEKDMRREEAANWARHFEWLENEADRYQAELFGGAEAQVRAWVDEGRFVLGPELVALGLAEMLEA
jgi:ATP-dependent Clp protease, protease subunit